MKEENKEAEELNGVELLKLIYEEVKNNSDAIRILKERIDTVYKELNEKIDTVYNELNEKIDTVHKELKEEIKDEFDYLDKKIDNTKKSLVIEISEEYKNLYEMTEKRINNLKKEMDTEIEDRKADVSKVKEFNKMIFNDIRGRVSILEEESEKYNLN